MPTVETLQLSVHSLLSFFGSDFSLRSIFTQTSLFNASAVFTNIVARSIKLIYVYTFECCGQNRFQNKESGIKCLLICTVSIIFIVCQNLFKFK